MTAGSAPAVSLAFGPNGMNGSTTHQPNGYTYDANGNMTVESLVPPNDLGYVNENRMTSFSGGGGTGTYVYDGNNSRVQKTAGGTTTVCIYSGGREIAEYDNGAAPSSPSREFIYSDGGSGAQLLARITGATVNYYHQDNLGTVRLMTDANGNDILNEGTYPFVESWYSNSLSNGEWVFTTYQHDTESGLDHALARFYDSRMGSFCSADPVGGDPTDPQSWNRYSYARNNPVNITDPSGRSWLNWLIEAIVGALAVALPEIDPGIFSFLGEAETGTATLESIPETTGFVANGTATATNAITVVSMATGYTLTAPVMASNISTLGLATGTAAATEGAQAAAQHPQQAQKPQPKPKKNCPPKFQNFFNHLSDFTNLATRLNTRPLFLMAQSSWETGWLGPHAMALHNLFGMTQAGHNDLSFSSFQESADSYFNSYSPYLSGKNTMEDFVNGLKNVPPNGYNTRDPNYYKEINDQQKDVQRHAADCGVSIPK